MTTGYLRAPWFLLHLSGTSNYVLTSSLVEFMLDNTLETKLQGFAKKYSVAI